MQYVKLVPREEGKFWGVTAAPIQSTVNLSIWIASAFRWSGWRVIEYQEQTNNLHSDGKIINNACQNRQRSNLKRRIRLVRWKSAWVPKQKVDLDTKINGNTGIPMAWTPHISLNTKHRNMRVSMLVWSPEIWSEHHFDLEIGKLAWMPQVLRLDRRKLLLSLIHIWRCRRS